MDLKYVIDNLYVDTFSGSILEAGSEKFESIVTKSFQTTNDVWYMEPIPEIYEEFKLKYSKILNLALSDNNEIKEFNVTSHPGNSSLNHSEIHLEELQSLNSNFKKIYVQCISYSSLIEKIDRIFEILVLDVEGHELSVLQSINQVALENQPKVIVIECGYDWKEKLEYLNDMGYYKDTYWENNCILSRNLLLDKKFANHFNQLWKKFIWFNKVIYENV